MTLWIIHTYISYLILYFSYIYNISRNLFPDSKGSRGQAWFRLGKPDPWHARAGPDPAQAWLPYPWYRSDCQAWARSVCHGHAMPMASTILPGLGPVSLPVLCHWHFELWVLCINLFFYSIYSVHVKILDVMCTKTMQMKRNTRIKWTFSF